MEQVVHTGAQHSDAFNALLQRIYAPLLHRAHTIFQQYAKATNPRNPYFTFGELVRIMLFEGGTPRAHATLALDSRHEGVAHVGFVECAEEDCLALFEAIDETAKARGVHTLRGPIDISTWQDFRALRSSDGPAPFFLEPYTQILSSQWEAAGYISRVSYVSTNAHSEDAPIKVSEGAHIQVERLTSENVRGALAGLHAVALDGFSSTWGFTPITLQEFEYIYAGPLKALDTFVILVAKEEGEIAGFFVGAPDLYNESGNTFVHKSMAVRKVHQGRGIGTALLHASHAYAQAHGFTHHIYSTIQESNSPVHAIVGKAQPFRHYDVFEKQL